MADLFHSSGDLGDLLDRADEDPAVLGVVLTGSRAREGTVTPHSDTDVILIVTNEGRQNWHGSHSADLDIAIYTLDELSRPALPRQSPDDWWNRYAFAHSLVLRDRLDGAIHSHIARQATLTAEEAAIISADYLDGYINFALRSLKSARDGRTLESRLDASESISYALVAIYAYERRIRPYNKYLVWDLTHHPLQNSEFTSTVLLRLLGAIQSDAHEQPQRLLFAAIEAVARRSGDGGIMDDWGAELSIFASRGR